MCVCLYSDTVDVLFDDGVKYTAPFRAVRRRVSISLISLIFDKRNLILLLQRLDKPTEHHYDSSTDSSEAAEARRSRARKRMRDDDSASQSSMSSPPSSPLTFSARKRPYRMVDSDSTETESDFDDPGHSHPHPHEMKPRGTGTSSGREHPLKPPPMTTSSDGEYAPKTVDPSSEEGRECSLTAAAVMSGSESEHPIPVKRGRGRPRKLREPYKLRKAVMLEPVEENEGKESVGAGGEGGKVMGGALLTPPSGDCTPNSKPIVAPSVSPNKESPKQIPNPTPPETPQTGSHSESGILKRMLSQDESPTDSDQTNKTPPTHEGSTSPSAKKKSPVSSRTRAQTKFENVCNSTKFAV